MYYFSNVTYNYFFYISYFILYLFKLMNNQSTNDNYKLDIPTKPK